MQTGIYDISIFLGNPILGKLGKFYWQFDDIGKNLKCHIHLNSGCNTHNTSAFGQTNF